MFYMYNVILRYSFLYGTLLCLISHGFLFMKFSSGTEKLNKIVLKIASSVKLSFHSTHKSTPSIETSDKNVVETSKILQFIRVQGASKQINKQKKKRLHS